MALHSPDQLHPRSESAVLKFPNGTFISSVLNPLVGEFIEQQAVWDSDPSNTVQTRKIKGEGVKWRGPGQNRCLVWEFIPHFQVQMSVPNWYASYCFSNSLSKWSSYKSDPKSESWPKWESIDRLFHAGGKHSRIIQPTIPHSSIIFLNIKQVFYFSSFWKTGSYLSWLWSLLFLRRSIVGKILITQKRFLVCSAYSTPHWLHHFDAS